MAWIEDQTGMSSWARSFAIAFSVGNCEQATNKLLLCGVTVRSAKSSTCCSVIWPSSAVVLQKKLFKVSTEMPEDCR